MFRAQFLNMLRLLDGAKDTRMERIQPGQNVFHPAGIQSEDGPDTSGRTTKQKPTQVLARK